MTDNLAEFQIGTADLRRGLQAVLPHVHPDPDYPAAHRIRFELSKEVVLLATDNFTAAMYSTSADHVRALGLDYFDLSPADAAKVLAVFKAGKDEDAEYPESLLQFDVTEKLIKIRDVSGMFAGHELELPANPSSEFPNVAGVFRSRLDHGPRTNDDDTVQVNAKAWGHFAKSGQVIGSPLTIDTIATPYLVTCSDVFVGALMPVRITDDIRSTLRDRLRRWGNTAHRVAGVHEGRRANAAELSERLEKAIRAVGVRQAATIVGVAEALGVGKAEARDVLEQLTTAGLLEKKGRKLTVMFAPDEVEQVIAAWGDSEPELPLDEPDAPPAGDPTPAAGSLSEETAQAVEKLIETLYPPPSPFSDTPAPASPFKDSDGNEWPTAPASPFGDEPPAPY